MESTEIDSKIGQFIRQNRQDRALSQGQLAILLGLEWRQIDRIEKGRRRLLASEGLLLCKYWNVSLEQALLSPVTSNDDCTRLSANLPSASG